MNISTIFLKFWYLSLWAMGLYLPACTLILGNLQSTAQPRGCCGEAWYYSSLWKNSDSLCLLHCEWETLNFSGCSFVSVKDLKLFSVSVTVAIKIVVCVIWEMLGGVFRWSSVLTTKNCYFPLVNCFEDLSTMSQCIILIHFKLTKNFTDKKQLSRILHS